MATIHAFGPFRLDADAEILFRGSDPLPVGELTRARRKHPKSMTAFDLTLQALHLIHQLDRTSMAQARTLLDQAITYDPDYAPAYSHMASLRMKWIGQ